MTHPRKKRNALTFNAHVLLSFYPHMITIFFFTLEEIILAVSNNFLSVFLFPFLKYCVEVKRKYARLNLDVISVKNGAFIIFTLWVNAFLDLYFFSLALILIFVFIRTHTIQTKWLGKFIWISMSSSSNNQRYFTASSVCVAKQKKIVKIIQRSNIEFFLSIFFHTFPPCMHSLHSYSYVIVILWMTQDFNKIRY